MIPEPKSRTTGAKRTGRVGAFAPALAVVGCLAACSLPIVGAAFATGLGAHLLGIPTWTYLILAAAAIATIIGRRRNRRPSNACESCDC